MDKNAIKKYAIWARRELIEKVSQKALQYGIEDGKELDPKLDSINGVLLTDDEKKQRQALIRKINENGYTQVMEEVAYTWFNRFIALRFMEVNGYLPSHVRVFTDEAGEFKPQIMSEALHLEFDSIDKEKIIDMKQNNEDDALYKYLLIAQCNELNKVLPGLFQKIADYTELLLPDYLLRDGSVIEQMCNKTDGIKEQDWTDQVQIIGWLYQYYNTESFDSIYDGNMSRSFVSKEMIPAATQLFTPEWVVKVMVENSLGRMWKEGHSSSTLSEKWEFYIDTDNQNKETNEAIHSIWNDYGKIDPQSILCLDPCMGSGHILVCFFDVLVQIYEEYGYSARESASMILQNNLYGLDLDERAAQLAEFALMMKARQYDRRIFEKGIRPNVEHFQNLDISTVGIKEEELLHFIRGFKGASDYGSLLKPIDIDIDTIEKSVNSMEDDIFSYGIRNELKRMIRIARIINRRYDVVVTNPPYLGNKRFNPRLGEYIKDNYPEGKADLAMAMLERIIWGYTKRNGYCAAITTVSWMYLKNIQEFRSKVIKESDFICLFDYGTELFEGKIGHLPIASWVSRNSCIHQDFPAIRLVDYCYARRDEKMVEFHNRKNLYSSNQENYMKIDGMPVAYWLSDKAVKILETNKNLDHMATTRAGMITGSNDIFVRQWFEISRKKACYDAESREEAITSGAKWFPYSKGGNFRKWYGNNESVVNWYNDGFEMRNRKDDNGKIPAHAFNLEYIFKTNVCWNSLSTNRFSARLTEKGFLYDAGGSFASVPIEFTDYYLGLLNSCVAYYYLTAFNPTLNFQKGNVGCLPIIINSNYVKEITEIVRRCVDLAKYDWDSYETSWGFKRHPLAKDTLVSGAYKTWEEQCNNWFKELKCLEEKLNTIFIDIYDLHEEVKAEVAEKDVSIRRANLKDDVRSLISYAVGCMFGRYSINESGLVCSDSDIDVARYHTYIPDKDAIIPICDDEYFSDDILGRFIEFVEKVYGKDTLEENLQFIADTIGGSGSAREVIRTYFMNDFYSDHLKMYQKKPIYWLFDSGKKNGFKCLVYMHRYQSDTIARIRTDYVHEQQARYRTAIEEIEKRLGTVSQSEKVKLTKKLNSLRDQDEELHAYEEKIHHLADQMINIDLDDGVKHNYALFQDVLAKIK